MKEFRNLYPRQFKTRPTRVSKEPTFKVESKPKQPESQAITSGYFIVDSDLKIVKSKHKFIPEQVASKPLLVSFPKKVLIKVDKSPKFHSFKSYDPQDSVDIRDYLIKGRADKLLAVKDGVSLEHSCVVYLRNKVKKD